VEDLKKKATLKMKLAKNKRTVIGVSFIALLFIFCILLVSKSVSGGDKDCSKVNLAVEKALPTATKKEDFEKLYDSQFKGHDGCKKVASSRGHSDEFIYYYNRITVGLEAGQTGDITSDADVATKAYEQLPSKDKNSLKYKFRLKAIKDIKAEVKQ
jgi:hypothetical protein